MTNLCPVCGYPLDFPASDNNICPSCGTEFGYSDLARNHRELRANWLEAGAPWFDTLTGPPPDWNPYLQIDNLISNRSAFAEQGKRTGHELQTAAVVCVPHHGLASPLLGTSLDNSEQFQHGLDIKSQFQRTAASLLAAVN